MPKEQRPLPRRVLVLLQKIFPLADFLEINSDQIVRHVAGCEFCAAEQNFLSAFNHTTEEYKFAEMPAQLRRLAEAMFVERLKDSSKGSKYGKESSFGRTGFRV